MHRALTVLSHIYKNFRKQGWVFSALLYEQSANGIELSLVSSVCPEVSSGDMGEWIDPNAVWGGEWGQARKGCIRFWW